MATYSAQYAVHKTLGAGVADTVTLNGCRAGVIRVTNRSAANPIYFRVSRNGITPTAPTAAADDTHLVMPNDATYVAWSHATAIVSLVSAGAQDYSVESIPGLN